MTCSGTPVSCAYRGQDLDGPEELLVAAGADVVVVDEQQTAKRMLVQGAVGGTKLAEA